MGFILKHIFYLGIHNIRNVILLSHLFAGFSVHFRDLILSKGIRFSLLYHIALGLCEVVIPIDNLGLVCGYK